MRYRRQKDNVRWLNMVKENMAENKSLCTGTVPGNLLEPQLVLSYHPDHPEGYDMGTQPLISQPLISRVPSCNVQWDEPQAPPARPRYNEE